MTYTIYIENHNLTREIMHKADALNLSGMIEEVLPSLILWHGLEDGDIPEALDFIRQNFGNIKIDVAESYWYNPSYCYDLTTMEVQLLPDGSNNVRHVVNRKQAENILKDLKGIYKADALYMDSIIEAVTEEGFWKLIKYGLIECCGVINNRKLYAI